MVVWQTDFALTPPITMNPDNVKHLVANALENGDFRLPYQGVPSTRNWVPFNPGNDDFGPLPRVASDFDIIAAHQALAQANEGDAFVPFYPNRYNPPTNGLFLCRTVGQGFSGHWWKNGNHVFYQLDL